jgi:enoyl-CoA hydratase
MIERELQDDVLTLRLTHGKANAMDLELLAALIRECETLRVQAEGADAPRALLLTGSGTIFSAGVDLVRLTAGEAGYVPRFFALLSDFFAGLFSLPLPVVAAVNGHAIAGGCLMVLAADYRVMAAGHGRIGVTELAVGLPFPSAALEIARFAVPRSYLQSVIYGAAVYAPEEALRMRLLDEVVASEDLEARARVIALRLAAVEPAVFRATKHSLRADALARMRNEADDAAALAIWCSPEAHARARAYMAKVTRQQDRR